MRGRHWLSATLAMLLLFLTARPGAAGADLEAMKRAGIGGVPIMEVDQGAPAGPVAFMSDQWRGLFKHMIGQAGRLGMQVNMNNDAGWNGENSLAIGVVNLWPNRMIGDEQLPEDTQRNPNGTLKEWPRWLEEGKPGPAGRYTFSTWKLWGKGDALQESGLLGPVRILTAESIPGEP